MRVSKKIFSVMLILLCTTIVGTSPTKSNPTLTTLKWKSSEILSDSEGESPTYSPIQTYDEYLIIGESYELNHIHRENQDIHGETRGPNSVTLTT